MQRYIVSEQIIGIMLSKCLVDGKDGLKLADLNVKVRSISNQIQQECKAIIDFAGKDIYKFIYDYEKYFNLEDNEIVFSEYIKNEMNNDYEGIKDLFDTKFVSGLPREVITIVYKNLEL